jgi:anti-sigma factor RsiW
MSPEERPPSDDHLLAMAYADGELSGSVRAEFEARLARDAALAREVTAQQRLHVLARQAAGPEPMDHEWNRIERSSVQRSGLGLAWALIVAGSLGLLGWAVSEELRSGLPIVPKISLAMLMAGLAALFLLTLRNRLRTMPYDPYTQVKR